MNGTSALIGFLGAGRIATALATAWGRSGMVPPERQIASAPGQRSRDRFAATGGATTLSNAEVVRRSEVIIVAVKASLVPQVLSEVAPLLGPHHMIISVAAGITLARLGEMIGGSHRIVRAMPNVGCLVSTSATTYCTSVAVTADDVGWLEIMFGAVGSVAQVPERLFDAVTAVSGCGPAFAALFIDALADGGVLVGLSRDTAVALAAQAVLGAAKLIQDGGFEPPGLKDAVASPGGATCAGLFALERGGLRATVIAAVEAAAVRAAALGRIDEK